MKPYYADESVTLYYGDAIEVMAAMPDRAVDVVLTDPPYSSGGRRENARAIRGSMIRSMDDEDWIRGDAMSTQGFTWLMRMCGLQWRRLVPQGGHVMVFTDWRMATILAAALETADLRQHPTIVWDKTHFGMGAVFRNQYELVIHMSVGTPAEPRRRDVGNVIACKPIKDGLHPTQKPVWLLSRILSVVCPTGGTVLDPFAGSGATAEAARLTDCKAVLVEADERYCETIANRMSQGVLVEPLPSLTPVGADGKEG